jgi:type I restriction enzyme M protein
LLDTDTKRRIDTARDILVGKVPDPKSQVEQITIALIYKFMDDMDAGAEELGGKRKFFTDKFARFGWAKLMYPGLSGHEMLNLYAEGITTMPENPGIPLLFRDIFKNAYLPYRDPETLKSFLKIINEFSYDHSERLGDAFEYLLSVLGSQGDAGQFRTPRHIIDFIVAIVNPKKNESILDPACGTAGFLISAYKHIVRANTNAKGVVKLTPDEKGRLAKNIKGYDISPDMVRLSLVNLYLHGFPLPQITEYDTLTSEEKWNELADVILANPPFMSPKGGIKPHKRFSIDAKRSEVLFVDYMAEHLTANGRAGIIVPEGIIERDDKAYRSLRKLLIEDSLIGVISLPAGLFLPYTKVKTSILILDRALARQGRPVLFSEVSNIGISLDSARNAIPDSDLPNVEKDYLAMRDGESLSDISWFVERKDLIENKYTLAGNRFRSQSQKGPYRWVPLSEVCHIVRGTASSTKTNPGEYPLVVRGEERLTSSTYDFEGEAVCVPLLSLAHGKGQIKRVHYVSGRFSVANLLAAVQPKDIATLNARYLYLALDRAKDEIARRMKGSVYVTLTIEDLASFRIPLPSMEVQDKISAKSVMVEDVLSKCKETVQGLQNEIAKCLEHCWGHE